MPRSRQCRQGDSCNAPSPFQNAPARATAAATSSPGPTLAIGGHIDAAGVVTAEPFYERDAVPDVPLGGTGAIEARMVNAGGQTLGSAFIDPRGQTVDGDPTPASAGVGSFLARVPLPAGTERVQLYRDGVLRFERTRSANAPTVTVNAPDGGEKFVVGDDVKVDWSSADIDGDPLHHLLALSTDGGATWSPLAADVTGSSFTFTATDTMVSNTVRVRVETTDGWRTASDTSNADFAIVPRTTAGRIAYVAVDPSTGGCALMTVKTDGSDPQTLLTTSNFCGLGNPKWSPDGTQIAFSGNGISVVDADGSHAHQIVAADGSTTGGCDFATEPDWSPDGKRIVFRCDGQLRIVNADGTGVVKLNVDDGAPQAWSPAGDRIAFTRPNAQLTGSEVVYVDPNGQNLTAFPLNLGSDPSVAWSPDATRIVYQSDLGFLSTSDPDGTHRTQLGPPPPWPNGAPHAEWSPDWSPAGDRFVLTQVPTFANQPDQQDLLTENIDGTDVVAITHDGNAIREQDPNWQAIPAQRDATIQADAGGPYTGPEGSAIALDASRSTAAGPITSYVWDLNGDGKFDDATGPTATLTPSRAGTLNVAVRVTDAAGHSDVAGAAVTATNVAPTVSFEAPGKIDADGHATIAARVADPGDEAQTITVDWNDGTPPEPVPLLDRATGAGDVIATHAYAGTGPHTAVVHADDGDGGQGHAATGFVAAPANTAPSIADASGRTVIGQPVAIPILAGDSDGDPVQVTVASQPTHGAAEVVAFGVLDQLLVYTPSAAFEGVDTLTVTGTDGHGGAASATVTVTIAPPPVRPFEPTAAATPPASTLGPPAMPVAPISPDAACANNQLRLTDVHADGNRVRIYGVAPAATRGQTVAITLGARGKRVATAVVANDLSFTATAPLPVAGGTPGIAPATPPRWRASDLRTSSSHAACSCAPLREPRTGSA